MKALLFASCLTLAVLPMCKPDTAKTTTEAAAANPASPAEVRAQFDILRDSADVNWQRMMTSDDQKLADVRALLQNLKKQPRLDAAQVRALTEQATRLKPQRYDRQSMASSELIDRYDAAQDSVLKPLVRLAAPDGNAPTAEIRDYVEHILKADADLVSYRAHYDAAAKAYNNYLHLHQAELTKIGGKYNGLRSLPLFELSNSPEKATGQPIEQIVFPRKARTFCVCCSAHSAPATLLDSPLIFSRMPRLFTSLRLPLLALVTSFALTSCFENCKKDDPKPKKCGTTTTTTTGNN